MYMYTYIYIYICINISCLFQYLSFLSPAAIFLTVAVSFPANAHGHRRLCVLDFQIMKYYRTAIDKN